MLPMTDAELRIFVETRLNRLLIGHILNQIGAKPVGLDFFKDAMLPLLDEFQKIHGLSKEQADTIHEELDRRIESYKAGL